VPSSMIVSSPVINYSFLAKKRGLILHTTITIGYDAPWRQVEALLLLAAEKTPGLLRQPPPFILQTFPYRITVPNGSGLLRVKPEAFVARLHVALLQDLGGGVGESALACEVH